MANLDTFFVTSSSVNFLILAIH